MLAFVLRRCVEAVPVILLATMAIWIRSQFAADVISHRTLEETDTLYRDGTRAIETNTRCIDFTGRTSFRELLALYSIARLMITCNSGPAHFAVLLDLPTIVLFGPETPRLYSPLGNKQRILYSEFACSPCVSVYNGKKSSCTDNQCLKTISVETVLQEALTELAGWREVPKVLAR